MPYFDVKKRLTFSAIFPILHTRFNIFASHVPEIPISPTQYNIDEGIYEWWAGKSKQKMSVSRQPNIKHRENIVRQKILFAFSCPPFIWGSESVVPSGTDLHDF
jgi:hypothetical protein